MDLNLAFMLTTFVKILPGLPVTLGLTFGALLVAAPLGFCLTLAQNKSRSLGSNLAKAFITFIRSVPIVIHMLIAYSLVPSLLLSIFKNSPWEKAVFDINPFWYALGVFCLYESAILAEIFRAAIGTIERGQVEAGLAIGLKPWQVWYRIIIPQALIVALPNLCTAALNLMKSSSLAFLMTVKEITALAKIEAARGYNYLEAWLVIFVTYLILGGLLQSAFNFIERKLSKWRSSNTSQDAAETTEADINYA